MRHLHPDVGHIMLPKALTGLTQAYVTYCTVVSPSSEPDLATASACFVRVLAELAVKEHRDLLAQLWLGDAEEEMTWCVASRVDALVAEVVVWAHGTLVSHPDDWLE